MKQILVAGAGLIGIRHCRHIAELPGMNLAGVIEHDAERLKGLNAPGFASFEAVDVPVDGVVIATPTHLHREHARQAAMRGWHMLIEKPVAETLEEADEIVDIAERGGVKTLVGHHRRHHGLVQKLKSLVEGGAIGRPIGTAMIWAMGKPDNYFKGNWRDGPHGSPVLINLVHDIDLLRFVLGEISHVTAMAGLKLRGKERVESGTASLDFENGAVGSILFSDASASPWGFEAGTGENPNIATTGQDMLWIIGQRGGISFPSLTVWSGAADWSKAPLMVRHEAQSGIPLVRQLEHFCAVMNGKCAPLCSAEDGRQTLSVALKVQAAMEGAKTRHRESEHA